MKRFHRAKQHQPAFRNSPTNRGSSLAALGTPPALLQSGPRGSRKIRNGDEEDSEDEL